MRTMMMLVLVLVVAGCSGGDDGGKVYYDEEPNSGMPLLLGTGGTYTIAGSCDGPDSDWFGIYAHGGEVGFLELSLDWDVTGANGTVYVTGHSEPVYPGINSVDLDAEFSVNLAEAQIFCDSGASFDYRGKFGVR